MMIRILKDWAVLQVLPVLLTACVTIWFANHAHADVAKNCQWSTYSITFPTVNTLTDKHEPFQNFATEVSNHLLDKVAGTRWRRWWLTEVEPGQKSDIEIVFYGFSAVQSAETPAFKYPEELLSTLEKDDHSVGLTSPWVRMKLDQKEPCHLRAVYVFNIRQFLMDQVNLAEGLPIADQFPIPFERRMFEIAMDGEYHRWFERNLDDLDAGIGIDPVVKNVVRRNASRRQLMGLMPPELVWLGEQTETFEFGFSYHAPSYLSVVHKTIDRLVEKITPAYVDLAVRMTGAFFRFDEPTAHKYAFSTIIELHAIVDRNKMRAVKVNPGAFYSPK